MIALRSNINSSIRRFTSKPSPRQVVALLVLLLLSQWCQASMNAGRFNAESLPESIRSLSESQANLDEVAYEQTSSSSLAIDSTLQDQQKQSEQERHGCCPETSSPEVTPETCENCVDDLLADSRAQLADTLSALGSEFSAFRDVVFRDSITLYWRYRETLWWGLSQPIYLLLGLFLE